MTDKMEKLIAEAEKEIAAGEVSGPFESLEEMFEHLDRTVIWFIETTKAFDKQYAKLNLNVKVSFKRRIT